MENNVPKPLSAPSAPQSDDSLAGQAVDRSLERRRAAARDEIERLISAALVVIERTGNLEPKVSDILAEAGLSNQAFYRHFRGKHELLVAVLDRGIRELASYLARRMSAADSPSEAIREWIRGMAAQAQSPTGARATRPFALARGRIALDRARVSGAMAAVDPEGDAEVLYHLMMGWVEARLMETQRPDASEVTRLESFAMAGLGREPSAGSADRPEKASESETGGETPQ
jgi:AcrR family transcriptional regulator